MACNHRADAPYTRNSRSDVARQVRLSSTAADFGARPDLGLDLARSGLINFKSRTYANGNTKIFWVCVVCFWRRVKLVLAHHLTSSHRKFGSALDLPIVGSSIL
ncbi:hypothetical protein FQZ97_1037210 [compost metagenome]